MKKDKKQISITDIRTNDIYINIVDCFEKDKIFLNPTISLTDLSVKVGTNTTYLSNTINKYYGCNLRSLINNYRVHYAEELLLSGKCSVRDAALKSGFTSLSTFFSAFQRVEGVSPLNFIIIKKTPS